MNLLLSENIIQYGLQIGITSPQQQFKEISTMDISQVDQEYLRDAKRAKRRLDKLKFLNSQCLTFRKIMGKSGLLFDPHIEYVDLMELGNKYVTSNSFTETPLITGRFIHSVASRVYDGLINMGSFNCQPAMNSQAIIRPLANLR